MLFGIPQAVKPFFAPVVAGLTKPIRRSLPVMVLGTV
jgi:hypothetical protein